MPVAYVYFVLLLGPVLALRGRGGVHKKIDKILAIAVET